MGKLNLSLIKEAVLDQQYVGEFNYYGGELYFFAEDDQIAMCYKKEVDGEEWGFVDYFNIDNFQKISYSDFVKRFDNGFAYSQPLN